MVPTRFLVVASLGAIALALAPLTTSRGATPPRPLGPFTPPSHASAPASDVAPIKVAIVKSWAGGTATGWSELNAEWPAYGTIPIQFDWTLAEAAVLTLGDLVATGADVVLLSNCAGDLYVFSPAEIDALQQYALMGHDIIGTFLVFRNHDFENRGLEPLFGLGTMLQSGAPSISNQFRMLAPADPLFAGVGDGYWTSSGYGFTQEPVDAAWDRPDLAGAQVVAACEGFKGIITIYRQPAYHAIYFSNMPEYYGDAVDKQLLYNAITSP